MCCFKVQKLGMEGYSQSLTSLNVCICVTGYIIVLIGYTV